jgi:cytochrome bd-type quinol oxidase subunit 2
MLVFILLYVMLGASSITERKLEPKLETKISLTAKTVIFAFYFIVVFLCVLVRLQDTLQVKNGFLYVYLASYTDSWPLTHTFSGLCGVIPAYILGRAVQRKRNSFTSFLEVLLPPLTLILSLNFGSS